MISEAAVVVAMIVGVGEVPDVMIVVVEAVEEEAEAGVVVEDIVMINAVRNVRKSRRQRA